MDSKVIILIGALAGVTVLATMLWVIYLIRLVQNNELIQEFKRAMVRKREMKIREVEDRRQKRIEESSKIRQKTKEMETQSLADLMSLASDQQPNEK